MQEFQLNIKFLYIYYLFKKRKLRRTLDKLYIKLVDLQKFIDDARPCGSRFSFSRGLYALECFVGTLSRKRNYQQPQIAIFEENKDLGTGTAWRLNQPDGNWNNISDRNLQNLGGREEIILGHFNIPAFPSFLEWAREKYDHEVDETKDYYFKRRQLGKYLNERATGLIDKLERNGWLQIHHRRITGIDKENADYKLKDGSQSYQTHNVLLALGHLETRTTDQGAKLIKHAAATESVFIDNIYSTESYEHLKSASSVAIKGMGLSMIDVVRMCIDADGTKFSRKDDGIFLDFKASYPDGKTIAPYSLDGLPPIPKPVGKIVDDLFDPPENAKEDFQEEVKTLIESGDGVVSSLIEKVALIAVDCFRNLENRLEPLDYSETKLCSLVAEWYGDPKTTSAFFISSEIPTLDYMRTYALMAYNEGEISLDYVAGQTWRKLQPLMYELFTHAAVSPATMEELIQIDEQLKPYTYGPPVESILQLIAFAEDGVLNLDFANDPDIDLVDSGFELKKGETSRVFQTLAESILADPVFLEVDDSLFKEMREKKLAEPVTPYLGIRTDDSSSHIVMGKKINGLYSIGRNTKGSVLGTDAILESFGSTVMKWAENFTERYTKAN